MTDHIDTRFSRTLGVAKKLVGQELNADYVYSKSVILTGESAALSTENGKWCFVDALRLLCRVVGHLTVVLPAVSPEFQSEVRQLCENLWSKNPIVFLDRATSPDFEAAAAVLNIGYTAEASRSWTSINSNGWVARVTSGTQSLPDSCAQPNPIAALMAASLGVTEVFKRVFEVSEEVAPLLEMVEFSLYELSTDPTNIGPELPSVIAIPDAVLFGAGAIGNAIALVLSQLPITGRLHVVDKQKFANENLETCSQTERKGWIGEPKAERLALWLKENSRLDATGQMNLIADAVSTREFKALAVDLVLNGLDDVQARHDAQMLWPAIIVDGGINEVGAAVVQHRLFQPTMACLLCSFKLPEENVQEMQRKVTGLAASSLLEQNRQITDEDVARADANSQPWLREMVKKKRTVCSVISEALVELGVNAEDGFQPSAPFVAAAAAALVVGEAIKALCHPEIDPPQKYMIGSLFLGPDTSIKLTQSPLTTCRCVVHKTLIERSHAERQRMKCWPQSILG